MSSDWLEPEARVRGSVVVVAGRGEHAAVYRRFARRIASDGYRVSVVDGDVVAANAAVDAADPSLPVVVVGSDTGAGIAVQSGTARRGTVSGLVLAGVLADVTAGTAADWEDELEVRSACPLHREVLATTDALDRGALTPDVAPIDADLLAAVTVPTLVIHGADDAISDVTSVQRIVRALPDGQVVVVSDGRHDILNDVSHRSVAAEIVQFLERLRLPGAPEIIVRAPVGALAG